MPDVPPPRERTSGSSHHASSGSSSGPSWTLPNIFGRRTAAAAPAVTSRVSTSTDQTHRSIDHERVIDELTSPKQAYTPLPSATTSEQTKRPAPFHLQEALAMMEPGAEDSKEVLGEVVKATAVHLANHLVAHGDALLKSSASDIPTADQINTLYLRSCAFIESSDSALCNSGIRLLAVLLAIQPPPKLQSETEPGMEKITVPVLYKLVTSLEYSGIEQLDVSVGALKALTKNGENMDGISGIVRWLLKGLDSLIEDWIRWCSNREDFGWHEQTIPHPFAPLRPASPSEAACAILELLTAVIAHHYALFAVEDITRVAKPILDFLWLGIAASSPINRRSSIAFVNQSRRASPASSSLNSPAPNASFGIGDEILSPTNSTARSRSTVPSRPRPAPLAKRSTLDRTASALQLQSPQMRSADPKWSRCFASFCAFIGMVTDQCPIENNLFERILGVICLALGQDDLDMMAEYALDECHQLLDDMMSAKSGRKGELVIRQMLEGKIPTISNNRSLKLVEEDRKIVRGAVITARVLLQGHVEPLTSLSSMAPSLIAAVSPTKHPDDSMQRQRWQPVDREILLLLQDHIASLEPGEGLKDTRGDPWIEGQALCDVMRSLVPVMTKSARREQAEGLALLFATTSHQIPTALSRLHSSTSGAPMFQHPQYINLLLDLSSNLDEEDATTILDYYQREFLCLPFTSAWIKNIWKLLDALFFSSSYIPNARRRVSNFLFHDIFGYAEDLPEHRVELVEGVLLPFLDRVLINEDAEEFIKDALAALVKAAVAETLDLDEANRQRRAKKEQQELEEEDSTATPSEDIKKTVTGGTFDAIRELIRRLATETPCSDEVGATPVPEPVNEAATVRRQTSIKGPSALRGLIGTLSPPTRATDPPNISTISSPMWPNSSDGPTPPPPPPRSQHNDCKSLQAVSSLISIFTRLTFALPYSQLTIKAIRTPASLRSITIYRDVLSLLYPITNDAPGAPQKRELGLKVPARCPRARLVILQWLMRLRADNRHRIYIRGAPDHDVYSFADTLHRTQEKEQELRIETETRRPRPMQAMKSGGEEERGRSARSNRSSETTARSRSRSKAPVIKGPDHSYHPLWSVPETLSVELPTPMQPCESMTTYDPNHPSLKVKDVTIVQDLWLPVSEYIRVLNGILRGHDWELVSYVLCFLPLQLRNKLFFHGRRATREIRALLEVISDGLLNTRSPWEKRFNTPTFITRVKINAVAYQSLSILISYRGVFSRDQCDAIIQALGAGLQGRREVAKPCLQALTLCIYELEQYVGRHLLEILERMKMILSTTAIAVHVLEFLIALAQNGNLFRNFTDEQYRLVFAVATSYIGEHNARSDVPSSDKEEYTLSQHVIGLAYHAIYLWFMALRLSQRPGHISEITRNLLSARSQRVIVDEMAEVCFDWLARYAYGNADPRPATSFLNEVVMSEKEGQPTKSQSWLLGGAIITVTSHPRTGWATIKTTRPTGTTSIISKLENVPTLDVGEANADLASLPAVLMANRGTTAPGAEPKAMDPDVKAIVDVKSTATATDNIQNSQHGLIWSGATPSQRRKDVAIEPSYLALQLLSSYPSASLDTPRGRLIPNEDKFSRTLRGIENTPVIDTFKIGVLYVGPGQSSETDILGNIDGSPLYLDFLSGLGRLIRLKGQVDVYVGGLNRDNDSDGEYAYAWWDDLSQMIFHTATMMPNQESNAEHTHKKRLIGNDFIKIVYNESGRDYDFNTIRTSFNFVNIVIAPHTPDDWALPAFTPTLSTGLASSTSSGIDNNAKGDTDLVDQEDFFKVTLQRTPGLPEFSPIGEGKIVSRRALPIFVRHIAHLANDMAARYVHIRDAVDMASAEYITSWRSRLRAMGRLRTNLPAVELPDENDQIAREELLRDFTRGFSYKPAAGAGEAS